MTILARKSALTAGLVTLSLTLSACVNSTGTQGEPNRTLIGAGLGALVGAAVDDDNRARGAIVGAALGGGAGALLDQQARDLRAAMSNDDVIITNTGEELRVVLPEGILFDFDSAAVRAELQGDIRALARNAQSYPNTTLAVIGHTDNAGSDSYNFDLSTRRAQAVAGIILEEGVSPGRVRSLGRGETQPIASNDTAAGRAQNRRVEIIITPTG
ncbi:MAG: OmpA family protein [Pseudomonadota bacterium]